MTYGKARIMNKNSMISSTEMEEIIQKLKENGYQEVVDCLIEGEKECYTKKGRLNKSSACRKLNWKSKKLEDTFREMRLVLQNEFDLKEEDMPKQDQSII